jgi:hypothetical protein
VAKFLKQAFSKSNQHSKIAARGLVVFVTTLTMTKYLNKFSPLLFLVKNDKILEQVQLLPVSMHFVSFAGLMQFWNALNNHLNVSACSLFNRACPKMPFCS